MPSPRSGGLKSTFRQTAGPWSRSLGRCPQPTRKTSRIDSHTSTLWLTARQAGWIRWIRQSCFRRRPSNPDNFKLYARDIMRYPLHARLVTISACYGSGLRAYAGEGLVGLSWAFLRAGAHNVIGALWEVNDASTPLLMDRLYGELEAGSSPDAALRAAKLSLIHSPAYTASRCTGAAFNSIQVLEEGLNSSTATRCTRKAPTLTSWSAVSKAHPA